MHHLFTSHIALSAQLVNTSLYSGETQGAICSKTIYVLHFEHLKTSCPKSCAQFALKYPFS
jgi:hypothetical protein